MSWRVVATLALGGLVLGAATPDSRTAVWSELGQPPIVDAGQGVTGWRFKDPTDAYSASLAASLEKPVLSGNYLLFCQGKCPADIEAISDKLPGMRHGALPVLRTYLPEKNLIPDTRRYIVDEQELAKAAPEIPVAAAAFQFGTEAVLGRYKMPGGADTTLAIFNYPTPQMARQQLIEFQRIPEAVVKRSGPLVAVVLHAPHINEANRLLDEIQYTAAISWDEKPPLIIRPQTAAQIVLGGLELAGIILVFCVVSGLAYAGIRLLRQRFGSPDAGQSMIILGLSDK